MWVDNDAGGGELLHRLFLRWSVVLRGQSIYPRFSFDDILNVVGWGKLEYGEMRLLDNAFEKRPNDVRRTSQLLMTAAKAEFLFFRNCTLSFCFSSFCLLE